MTQADDYRHCTPIYYPGFSALHPSSLPVQNNKPISLSNGIGATLSCYEEILLRYGIRHQLPKYLKNPKMKDFTRDAFWWIFLEHFVSVDFDALLQQVKGNTLVSDEDMKAFQFDTVVPTHLQISENNEECIQSAGVAADAVPTLPILKSDASIGAPTRHRLRDAARKLPAHLERLQSGNRKIDDVALIGSPRCVSALSIAESVESRPQSALKQHPDPHRKGKNPKPPHSSQVHPAFSMSNGAGGGALFLSSMMSDDLRPSATPSPRANIDGMGSDDDGDFSDTSSTASTIISAMRVTNFGNSRAQLNKLPLDVRLQIAAKEQHQLFTRMALNYGGMCTETMGMNVGLKDAITRLLPEVMAQLIYFLFARSIPYAMRLLDIPFQISLGQKLSFWIGGVERIYNVRNWGIHAFLDPIKRLRKQSRAQSMRVKDRRSATSRERGASAKELVGERSPRERGVSTKEIDRSASRVNLDSGSYAPAPPPGGPRPSNAPARGFSVTARPRKSDSISMLNNRDGLASRASDARSVAEHSMASSHNSDTTPESSKKPSDAISAVLFKATTATANHDASPRTSDQGSAGRRSDWVGIGRNKSDAPPSFMIGSAHMPAHPSPDLGDGLLRNASTKGNSRRTRKDLLRVVPGTASGISPEEEELAKQRRRDQIVKRDVDAMKSELTKLKVTHTFAQFHYSGQVVRQVPTFRDSEVEVDPNDGKLIGVEERLPSRIAQAFTIGPKKRNIQVIKKDLDSKFLSNPPWYAGRNQRVAIKDSNANATRFALNNWSPLLHRFMLANGEENLKPTEHMNWTI